MTNEQHISKGLEGVVVEKSKLSRVDGKNGVLVYCGYNIDDIADCSYEEIVHLFLFEKLPNENELEKLNQALKNERSVPCDIIEYIKNVAKKNHPMATLRTSVSMMSPYIENLDDFSADNLRKISVSLISKTATIAAYISAVRSGLSVIDPDPSLDHAANFLKMCNNKAPSKEVCDTMNTALVLHADHSFNASTFTARVVASSLSDMVSSITAAIGSLKGPLHGGANTAVMNMLKEINDVSNVEPWLNKALLENKKIMGFGHRVYKVLDPRAKHLKKMSEKWAKASNDAKWFEMSNILEGLMMKKKNIAANVDFYSASTYYAMGIDPSMYTTLFAVARVVGWAAHYIEQVFDNRIMRPKALYVGKENLKYRPLTERE